MPTLLVRDVLYRVSVSLGDYNPQFTQWTEQELVGWLNDFQMVLAKLLPLAVARTDTIKLSNGSRQTLDRVLAASIIPGDGSTAADAYGVMLLRPIRNMGATGQAPGKPVRIVEHQTLDAALPTWHTATGKAVLDITYNPQSPRQFYAYPAPGANNAVWLQIEWAAYPKAIPAGGAAGSEVYLYTGSNATLMSTPDEHVDDAVAYVLARAHQKLENIADAAKGAAFEGQFLASMNRKIESTTGNNPNLKNLPLVPQLPAAAS